MTSVSKSRPQIECYFTILYTYWHPKCPQCLRKKLLSIHFYTYLLTARFPKSINNLRRKSLDSRFPDSYIICGPCKTLGTYFISLENCQLSRYLEVLYSPNYYSVGWQGTKSAIPFCSPYEFPIPGNKADD